MTVLSVEVCAFSFTDYILASQHCKNHVTCRERSRRNVDWLLGRTTKTTFFLVIWIPF